MAERAKSNCYKQVRSLSTLLQSFQELKSFAKRSIHLEYGPR